MQDNKVCKEQILERHSGACTGYHTKIWFPPKLCLVVHGVERPKKPGNKTPGPSLPTGDCPKLRPVGNLRSTRVPCFNPFDVFSDLHIWNSYRTYTVKHHNTSWNTSSAQNKRLMSPFETSSNLWCMGFFPSILHNTKHPPGHQGSNYT